MNSIPYSFVVNHNELTNQTLIVDGHSLPTFVGYPLGYNIITKDITFASRLIPDTTNTFDLGTNTKKWRNIETQSVNTSNITIDSTAVIINGSDNILYANYAKGNMGYIFKYKRLFTCC